MNHPQKVPIAGYTNCYYHGFTIAWDPFLRDDYELLKSNLYGCVPVHSQSLQIHKFLRNDRQSRVSMCCLNRFLSGSVY
jgi:hypothetical protein